MDFTDDSQLPDVTDEMLQDALTRTKSYTVVVLKAGPKFLAPGADRDPEVASTIWAHGKRNFALRAAGLMPIVCPVLDESGVTGVGIFDTTPEDVDRIMANDPGVRAGIFTYDIHPSRSFPGSTLPG
ncbi:MAG TPA: hypothetical protein VKE25_05705 [Actinomycetes bacterium]|nr:hypothetical protein [Actinomycetes bacterium]